jgi:hypothetical protein
MYYFVAARKAGMEAYGPYVPQFDLTTLIDSAGFYLVYIAFNLISPNQALIGFSILTLIAILTFNRSAIWGAPGSLSARALSCSCRISAPRITPMPLAHSSP